MKTLFRLTGMAFLPICFFNFFPMHHLTYKIVFGGIVGKYKQKTNITAPKQTYYVVVLQGAVC
jgi:hypothetical protein